MKTLLLFVLAAWTWPAAAQVNNWINPSSGKWEDAFSWSLGILPASDQIVNITNAGYKAVDIDSATMGFSGSLTVSNLNIGAPGQDLSTLLLNYFGSSAPLKVLGSCIVSTNGDLRNLYSSFEVDGTNGGALTIDGGSFDQEGGQTVVSAPVNLKSGYLRATDADLTLGQVSLGTNQQWGYVQQAGGSIAVSFLNVLRGSYNLAGGNLYTGLGMQLSSDAAAFYQTSGTNYGNITAGENSAYQLLQGMAQGNVLSVADSANHWTFEQDGGLLQMAFINVSGGTNYTGLPSFEVTNGIVQCGTLNIGGNGVFGQNGGQVFLTNNFDLHGESFIAPHIGFFTESANYALNGGQLQAPSMSIGQYASFRQYGGSFTLPGGLNLTLPTAGYLLGNGSLQTTYTGVSGSLVQTGGKHEVDGVLSVLGIYDSEGGETTVQGLYLRGTLWLSGSGVFTNAGLLNLGGTISASVSNAILGQVQLATNTVLAFTGFPARASFNASAGIAWTAGAVLTISNWNSNAHVYFGSAASALTSSQLEQITFLNPGGFAPGTYPAQILSSGEVVPAQRPTLVSSRTASGLVLTWPDNYQLLSATNVAGPYNPVSGASSPWTNTFANPREFFLLQGM